MKTKFFMRIMCLMLAMLCLPVRGVFAAKTESGETAKAEITQIIYGLAVNVELPAGGRVPSFEASTESPEYRIATGYDYEYDSQYYHNYYRDGIQWYDLDNDRALKAGEAFVTGTRYRVDIGISITYKDYDIFGRPYYAFDEELKGYINGIGCDISALGGYEEKWYRELSYTFPPCEDAPDDITAVSLWLDAPVSGAAPDYEFTANGAGFKTGYGGTNATNGILWYDSDTLAPLGDSDTFIEGHSYTVAIELNSVSPYLFATNSDGTSKVQASVNGNVATVYCNYQTVSNMDEEIWVRYNFGQCTTLINSVEVMDFSLPREGAKGDINMSSPDDGIYKVTGIVWKSSTETIAAWYDTGYRSQNGVFEKGVTYTVEVTLKASEGYKFAAASSNSPTVTASANGF